MSNNVVQTTNTSNYSITSHSKKTEQVNIKTYNIKDDDVICKINDH